VRYSRYTTYPTSQWEQIGLVVGRMKGPWGQILKVYWIAGEKHEIISERWLESAEVPEGSEDFQGLDIVEETRRP